MNYSADKGGLFLDTRVCGSVCVCMYERILQLYY